MRRVADALWKMAEFVVLHRFRGTGVGAGGADALRALPGAWRAHEAGPNIPAQTFWRRVIGAATGGQFVEESNAAAVVQRFVIGG